MLFSAFRFRSSDLDSHIQLTKQKQDFQSRMQADSELSTALQFPSLKRMERKTSGPGFCSPSQCVSVGHLPSDSYMTWRDYIMWAQQPFKLKDPMLLFMLGCISGGNGVGIIPEGTLALTSWEAHLANEKNGHLLSCPCGAQYLWPAGLPEPAFPAELLGCESQDMPLPYMDGPLGCAGQLGLPGTVMLVSWSSATLLWSWRAGHRHTYVSEFGNNSMLFWWAGMLWISKFILCILSIFDMILS